MQEILHCNTLFKTLLLSAFASAHTELSNDRHTGGIAVREAGLACHINCFVYTINLATKRALSEPRISSLVG